MSIELLDDLTKINAKINKLEKEKESILEKLKDSPINVNIYDVAERIKIDNNFHKFSYEVCGVYVGDVSKLSKRELKEKLINDYNYVVINMKFKNNPNKPIKGTIPERGFRIEVRLNEVKLSNGKMLMDYGKYNSEHNTLEFSPQTAKEIITPLYLDECQCFKDPVFANAVITCAKQLEEVQSV